MLNGASKGLGLAILLAGSANAQFFERLANPQVDVAIEHPPALGLSVERIAFGPATGECSEDVINAVISGFIDRGIEVVDRANLNQLLAEHDLSLSGYVDQTSATKIGQILGPSALIFIKISRCRTETDRLTQRVQRRDGDRKYTAIKYISRTRSFLKGSIQTVDLATGRIFTAKTFEYSPEESTYSYQGYPDPPDKYEVLDQALGEAATYIQRLFVSWTETQQLIYYNGKRCNLKRAFDIMRGGDVEGAQEVSLENLDTCMSDPAAKDKHKAQALYNVGIGHFIEREYDEAIGYFQRAATLRGGPINAEALANARRAQVLQSEMQEVVERAEVAAASQAEAAAAAERKSAANTLTNNDVVALSRSGLPRAVILSKIKNSKNNFDTTTDGLIALTKAGVHEDVIAMMIEVAGG